MGLVKQSTQESYTKGLDVPSISPLSNETPKPGDAIQYIKNGYGKPMSQYEIRLDRRISLAGIVQATLQSQGLLLEPNDGYIKKVKEVSLDLFNFIEENSR